MSARPQLVIAVVTAPVGLLLIHRPGESPPVMLPALPPLEDERPAATAERAAEAEARVRVRAGRVLGHHVRPGERRPVTYVAATPTSPVTEESAVSLHCGWYTREQIALLLPDLVDPVRRHLERTVAWR